MWPNPQFPADLVTFTDEILNEKFHFLCEIALCSFESKNQIANVLLEEWFIKHPLPQSM